MRTRRPSEAVQVVALTRAFLARFFENENTAGRGDLRESFFWLIAALATPGLALPCYQQFHWTQAFNYGGGIERLRAYALVDKAFYLTLAAAAIGLLSAVTWNALLVDRRDGLILGSLPVAPRTVLAGKMLALATYILLVSTGMHAGASVLYGGFLGSFSSWTSMARDAVSHFVASSALTLFVFGLVVGVQSTCLAVVGPRRFGRPSAALQLLVVGAVITLLMWLPAIATASADLPRSSGSTAWIMRLPPTWFLGLYETLVGTPLEVMHALARTAMLALASVTLLVGVTYPIACRRVLSAAVQSSGVPHGWPRVLARRLTAALARGGPMRAAIQFFLATMGRVGQHRLVLSIGVGVGLALIVPTSLYWATRTGAAFPARPVPSLLSAPLVVVFFTVGALRLAMALPSELGARWIFDAAPGSELAGRSAARRILLAVGVAPPLGVATAVWWLLWGPRLAVWHLTTSGVASLIATECFLWGFAGMPCAEPLSPGRSNLQARWPLYAMGLATFAFGLPALAIITADEALAAAALIMGLLATLVLTRRASDRDAWINAITGDPQGLLILDLAGADVHATRRDPTVSSRRVAGEVL